MTSSTTATVRMKARRLSGNRRPTKASIPSANAVSVDIAVPPAVSRGAPGVQRQIDRDRDQGPAQAGSEWERQAAPLAQFAEIELPARLQSHHEEEERHQPVVDPVA
jgi:hypothetical protein